MRDRGQVLKNESKEPDPGLVYSGHHFHARMIKFGISGCPHIHDAPTTRHFSINAMATNAMNAAMMQKRTML